MEESRKDKLSAWNKDKNDKVATHHSYTKSSSSTEQSQVTIGHTVISFKKFEYMKEKDGISLPHLVRQV